MKKHVALRIRWCRVQQRLLMMRAPTLSQRPTFQTMTFMSSSRCSWLSCAPRGVPALELRLLLLPPGGVVWNPVIPDRRMDP